ncbi:hypothetical protein BDF21DRAFT_464015 [Thamnidium elegans]|nr:hypothetical protein BDF21DRAFT_464015 [Thamnidium elegans]
MSILAGISYHDVEDVSVKIVKGGTTGVIIVTPNNVSTLRINTQRNITSTDEDLNREHIITKEGIGVRKTEDYRFDNSIDIADSLSFSRTDNDVKTMAASVDFPYESFLFHLGLYNKQNQETEPTALTPNQKDSLKLKPEVINAEDIAVASGDTKARRNLQNSKTQQVKSVEKLLSINIICKSSDIHDEKKRYDVYSDNCVF